MKKEEKIVEIMIGRKGEKIDGKQLEKVET